MWGRGRDPLVQLDLGVVAELFARLPEFVEPGAIRMRGADPREPIVGQVDVAVDRVEAGGVLLPILLRVRGEPLNMTFVRHLFLARREQAGDLRRRVGARVIAEPQLSDDGHRDRDGEEKA
jgi:hypothetical protein